MATFAPESNRETAICSSKDKPVPFKRKGITWRTLSTIIVSAWLVFLSAPGLAYTPFTEVGNACPSCAEVGVDEVTLSSGIVVKAQVVSENEDFYTLYRYGEYRTVETLLVKSIKWNKGKKPASLGKRQEFILTNGKTFSGIVKQENEQPSYIILTLPEMNREIVLFTAVIAARYDNGRKAARPVTTTVN